jgi:hypothetical protein
MKKLTAGMLGCLRFLHGHGETMVKTVGKSATEPQIEEYRSAYWWPRDPTYSWGPNYGFEFGNLQGCIRRGLVERKPQYSTGFRITPAGRQALANAGEAER